MDTQIKQLLSNPNLYPSPIDSTKATTLLPIINGFVSKLRAAGKLTANLSTRSAFFSLHLAHLQLGMEFLVDELVKKSSLTPANYNREFSIILKHCEQAEPVISLDSVASFYGCPLKEIISTPALSKQKAPEQAEYWLAVMLAVSQAWKGNWRLGTVAEMARLWGQSAEGIKAYLPALKEALKTEEMKSFIERLLKKRTESHSSNTASPKQKAKRAKIGTSNAITSPFALDVHPLYTFSCSTIGPAFGPIWL